MTRARDFADLAGSADAGGLTGRNLIINPSGAVDQRGGSSTINEYSVDRWRSFGGPGGFTISQRTDAGEGDGNAIRFHRTAGNSQTSAIGIAQGIETKNSKFLAGKTVILSFRARKGADWSPTNFDAIIYSGEGTDENPVGMTNMKTDIIVNDASLTTSFQTFTASVTIESDKTQLTVAFLWTPSGTAGAADYVDIREVQLELGEKATPFEHRSFGDELARCQRYFFQMREGSGEFTQFGHGRFFSTSAGNALIRFPQCMRANPDLTALGATSDYDFSPTNLPQSGQVVTTANAAGSTADVIGMAVGNNFSSVTTGAMYVLGGNAGTGGAAGLQFDAEL